MGKGEKIQPSLYDVPIDMKQTKEQQIMYEVNPDKFKSLHDTVPSGSVSVRSEVFVALREMMDTIVRGTDWRKKARIVLEYDPRDGKMELITFQSENETQRTEDR